MPISLDALLDLEDSGADAFLDGLQGNIIKGHGRDFTRHLLLKMTGDPAAVKRWIARFAAEQVTSAQEQRRQRDAWRAHGGAGERFAMFLLSSEGYRYLGFTDAQLPAPVGEFIGDLDKEYFLRGMKRQAELGELQPPGRTYKDPPSEQWEAPYRGRIDAMVLLAHDNPVRLEEFESEVTGQLSGLFEVLTTECGRAIKKTFPGETVKKTIEHFGFQDGISQPLMIQQDLKAEIDIRGRSHWNPEAPLRLALVPEEPDSPPDALDRLGSFMVFRKLEQDVTAFREAMARLASSSGVSPEAVGAMAVGRLENGKPVLPGVTVKVEGADPNDFQYDQDAQGAKCPFHAHIRKTNPRGDLPRRGPPGAFERLTRFERARRVVRRGITYDERLDGAAGAERAGVGLLFMCFQSNLDQFVIQQDGSDSNDFVKPGVGFDAVIGQFHGEDAAPDAPIEQTWPSTGTVKFKMVNFVRMRGGEYFFAPSMRFLRGLAHA